MEHDGHRWPQMATDSRGSLLSIDEPYSDEPVLVQCFGSSLRKQFSVAVFRYVRSVSAIPKCRDVPGPC